MPSARLKGRQRIEVLRALANGATQMELARHYGVSQSTISRTVHRNDPAPERSGD